MKGVVGFQRELESVDGAVCPICGFEATSGSQLAGHLGSVHGHTNIAWSFIQSSSCRICLRQFWDVQRLFAHLNASNCCLALSFAILEPNQLQDDVVIGGDLDGDSRDFAKAPPVRKAGPLRPTPVNVLEVLSCGIAEASILDRRALCKSARVLSRGSCEIFDNFLDVMQPPKLSLASARPLPQNPDGRLWRARGAQRPPAS